MSKIKDLFKSKKDKHADNQNNALAKFSHFVMTHKAAILIVFVVLIIAAVIGNTFVKKQSDVISYLDNDTVTKHGLATLQSNFNIIGDFSMGISYLTEDQVAEIVDIISDAKDNTDSEYHTNLQYINKIVWIGTFDSLKNNKDRIESSIDHLNNGGVDDIMNTLSNKFVLQTEITKNDGTKDTVNTYLISVYFTTANSADETIAAIDSIEEIITSKVNEYVSNGTGYADVTEATEYYTFSGSAQNSRSLLKSSVGDMPKFVVVAVIAVFIILFFTTQSYIEPLIFLATLGISILLNMGSNVIAGKDPIGTVSSITASCATILQLAVAMDYAIFLMHTYYEELRTTPRPEIALERALPKTIKSIVASSLTTVGSFIALFFMKFGIGYDLGFVLAKGVLLSLLAVVFLQPIIILYLNKWIAATNHEVTKSGKHQWKPLTPRLKFISKVITKKAVAIPIIVICIGLMIPGAIFQGKVNLSFISITAENENPTVPEAAIESSSNQLIVMTPYKLNDYDSQYNFVQQTYLVGYTKATSFDANATYYTQNASNYRISKAENVTAEDFSAGTYYIRDNSVNTISDIFSITTVFEEDQLKDIDNLDTKTTSSISDKLVYTVIKQTLYKQLYSSFISDICSTNEAGELVYNTDADEVHYVLYTMTINGGKEDTKSYETVLDIQAIAKNVFSEYSQSTQMTGNVVASYELSQVTPSDYTLVNVLSVVIIFLVLLFTFKSFILSVILVLVIETGIWINLSISYFMGTTLHFMAYLIVSAIALGATVDYAILLTSKYLEEKESGMSSQASIRNAIYRAAPGVLTSGSIFFVACLAVGLISTNIIVQQITSLLARNAVFSVVLVFTFLPAVLSIKERIQRAISIKRGKGDPDEGKQDVSIYSMSSKDLAKMQAAAAVAGENSDVVIDTIVDAQTEDVPDTIVDAKENDETDTNDSNE